MGLLVNTTDYLKEGSLPILYNLFQKTEAERTFPNSFYETRITLKPK